MELNTLTWPVLPVGQLVCEPGVKERMGRPGTGVQALTVMDP